MDSILFKKFLPSIRKNVLLRDYTTFRIGGPADFFYEAKTEKNLIKAVKTAKILKMPYFILGNGSNILFSDKGFRGLVIRNLVSGARIIKHFREGKNEKREISRACYIPVDQKKYLQFSDLDYPQEPFDTEIQVCSGAPLPQLIQWSLKKNLCGLQWFAGIPGSVGGAVVCNVHGGTKLFSDYIEEITVLDKDNKIKKIRKSKAGFAYDFSRFQKEESVILKVNIFLSRGDIKRANLVYEKWRQRKLKVQPQTNCPGSVFKNFSESVVRKRKFPTTAAGWFIDQCGLKGKTVGGVEVSEKHANFFVNFDHGTAEDVKKLIRIAKKSVKNEFNLDLEEEIMVLPEKI